MSWITKERRALETFSMSLHDEGIENENFDSTQRNKCKRMESDHHRMIKAATMKSISIYHRIHIYRVKTCFHYQATAKPNYSLNKLISHVKKLKINILFTIEIQRVDSRSGTTVIIIE